MYPMWDFDKLCSEVRVMFDNPNTSTIGSSVSASYIQA